MESEPYFWAARNGWYVKLLSDNGKRSQLYLGETKKQAKKAYQAILKAEEEAKQKAEQTLFETLVDSWLGVQMVRVQRGEVTLSWLDRRMRMLTRFMGGKRGRGRKKGTGVIYDYDPPFPLTTPVPFVASWIAPRSPSTGVV